MFCVREILYPYGENQCRLCNRYQRMLLHQYPVFFSIAPHPKQSTTHVMLTTSMPHRVMLATVELFSEEQLWRALTSKSLAGLGLPGQIYDGGLATNTADSKPNQNIKRYGNWKLEHESRSKTKRVLLSRE